MTNRAEHFTESAQTEQASDSPLSLERLTAAFAQMLGGAPARDASASEEENASLSTEDACAISPVSIVEAALFVGRNRAGGEGYTASELAEAMRDVSPEEVIEAVNQLNASYERDDSPYRIACSGGAFRLTLTDTARQFQTQSRSTPRTTKLSPVALEILSIIAYKQPIDAATIDHLRDTRSSGPLRSLVRYGLVRIDRDADAKSPHYRTTEQFLQVFGLSKLADLPRAAELEG